MSAREALPYVNDIRSSRLCVLPAGTISTSPRIFRRIDGGRVPSAQHNHLHPLLGHLGRGQMADRSAVEQFTKRRGYVGRGLGYGISYRGVLHRFEERIGLDAGLYASAQSLGLLFSCLVA